MDGVEENVEHEHVEYVVDDSHRLRILGEQASDLLVERAENDQDYDCYDDSEEDSQA